MSEAFGAVTFIAATALEYKALRREMPHARVVQTGIGLARLHDDLGEAVISCGLAGGLREDLPTGTVLIPRVVLRPSGKLLHCDGDLVDALAMRARNLSLHPIFDPLVTASKIVGGTARASWAARGYSGVDMESGIISAARIAVCRVVLDTPQHEISADWRSPFFAMLKPWNWPQALWLLREAPRAASLAARVAAGVQGETGAPARKTV